MLTETTIPLSSLKMKRPVVGEMWEHWILRTFPAVPLSLSNAFLQYSKAFEHLVLFVLLVLAIICCTSAEIIISPYQSIINYEIVCKYLNEFFYYVRILVYKVSVDIDRLFIRETINLFLSGFSLVLIICYRSVIL